MSNPIANNLSKEKIQQLLAAVGTKPEKDTSRNIEAAEYDWRQPHRFSKAQLKELDNFATRVVAGIAENFTQLYDSRFDVKITSKVQLFANSFTNSDHMQSDYFLAFNNAQDQVWGLVGVPSQTAITWTKQLLGDSKSAEDSSGNLSQLEECLLLDIASGIVEAISNSHERYELNPNTEVIRGQLPFELEGIEELYKITFNVSKADSGDSLEAYFIILSDKLEVVAGKKAQVGEDLSAKDAPKAMLTHVQQTPVSVTAQLASAMLTFEEIMTLSAGDILLLDKKTNEPIELIVEDRILFLGRAAKSAGNYATVITETAYNTK